MKRTVLIPALSAICATAYADPMLDATIVTDPSKIVDSTTYDLGDRLLTVQELTKEALPMPPPPPPIIAQPTNTPRRNISTQNHGFINVGATIYRRANQPTRSFIRYHINGQTEAISFWSSADWSIIAGLGNLTAPDGKIWHLMCMPNVYDLDRQGFRQQMHAPAIPEMPAGSTSYQVVSGIPTAEQMAPIALYHAYYDAHLSELLSAHQARIAEQQRLAVEAKANVPVPADIVVQFRVLEPDEIVTPPTTPQTSDQ